MYKKRDPARANLLFCLLNLCCFDVLVAVAVAVVARHDNATWNENEKERGRNWARLPVLNFPLCYWATLGAIDFSCAVSCFRVVQIVEQHSRKNLSWNPGYGQARLRSVRAIVTVVAFSFLNLPVSLLLTINRRYLNCCSNSFLSLHDCVVEHIYYNSISCC